MHLLRMPLLAAVFLTALTPCHAADKRLSAPVTLDAVGTDLGRLAADLSKQTGVCLRVMPDISDEKLDVFTKAAPLSDVQKDVATLFHYRWAAEKRDGQTAYLLWRDGNTRDRQQRLRNLLQARAKQVQKDEVNAIGPLFAMKDEDVNKLPKDQQDFARAIRSDHNADAYQMLGGLSASDNDALLNGNGVTRDVSSLSKEQRASLFSVFFNLKEDGIDTDKVNKVALEVPNHNGQTGFGGADHMFTFTVFENGEPREGRFLGLTPEAIRGAAPKPDAVAAPDVMRDLTPGDDTAKEGRLKKPIHPAKARVSTHNGKEYHDDSEGFHDGLRRLAESTGMPVLCDFYTVRAFTSGNVSLTGLTAVDAANKLAAQCGFAWARHGNALLFRTNLWPVLMPKEVPMRILEALKAGEGEHKEGYGPLLTLKQSLVAAQMTDEQLANLHTFDFSALWADDVEKVTLLRFLRTLGPTQWVEAWSASGLGLKAMGSLQSRAFDAFYDARWRSRGYAPQALSLKIKDTPIPDDVVPQSAMEVSIRIALPNETKNSVVRIPVGQEKRPKPAAVPALEQKPEAAAKAAR